MGIKNRLKVGDAVRKRMIQDAFSQMPLQYQFEKGISWRAKSLNSAQNLNSHIPVYYNEQ